MRYSHGDKPFFQVDFCRWRPSLVYFWNATKPQAGIAALICPPLTSNVAPQSDIVRLFTERPNGIVSSSAKGYQSLPPGFGAKTMIEL